MSKFVIALILVVVLLAGGLMKLLANRRQPMGSPEVLERAKQRNRELDELALSAAMVPHLVGGTSSGHCVDADAP